MRTLFIILLIALLPGMAKSMTPSHPSSDSFTVYLFLLEDCKITQAYADKMQSIYAEYAKDSIGFQGFFPNPISVDSSMQAFIQKYNIPFACTRTHAYARAKQLGVTVTPEVVVYNETRQTIVYQGRINNLYERVGQRRQVVTSHELEAALYSIRNNKPVPIPKTTAIGCFLN